jgi:hypothetical protein
MTTGTDACQHDWWRLEDGSIDTESWGDDPHFGPMCKKCGEWFCITCEPDRWEEVEPGKTAPWLQTKL